MSKRRDRHGRGLRGPLSGPNEFTGTPIPLRQRAARIAVFRDAVEASITRILRACPQALVNVAVGFEDVPSTDEWHNRVPLAAATSPRPGQRGHVVLFRRPIEARTGNVRDLRELVHRTILSQMSSATGLPIDELDPTAHPEDWDD